MPTDRFYIGYTEGETGLNTYFKPYAIPDTAYSQLLNAYVFRGRVRKRFGSRYISDDPVYGALQSRLRVQVGVTTTNLGVPGYLVGNVAALTVSGITGAVGQGFSIGNVFFTIFNPTPGIRMMNRTDSSAAMSTYNIATTAFVLTGAVVPDGTPVYFYPSLPVMGLLNYETANVSSEFIVGFDTTFAYQYLGGWQRLYLQTNAGDATWIGDNTDFFWGATWTGPDPSQRVFFVTNNNKDEPNFMRYLTNSTWTTFRPLLATATVGGITTNVYLDMAAIIVPFHNRLLLLNTWESTIVTPPGTRTQLHYPNRCRYSKSDADPTAVNTSYLNTPGQGGGIDAPTTEEIITVEFVKDRLIVFFSQSTWELVYTGNQALPFTWQQINTELGAESTFSIVPFDKVCIGVGNVGIHACNGSNVERIDSSIPDAVFNIHNDNGGIFRVYGIRDYTVETIYWTFPDTDSDATYPYPNRVLVYNYKTGAWAFNDDSITVFGYFQPNTDITWLSNTVKWSSTIAWGSGTAQAKFRAVVAGNQEGYTFICDADEPTNASVLQATYIALAADGNTQLTIIDHNLRQNEYVYVENAVWSDGSAVLNNNIYLVVSVIDANNIEIDNTDVLSGTYKGGGVVARVSQISILTKEYNFYAKQGRNAFVSKVDFLVDSTGAGEIQADFYTSSSTVPLLQDGEANGSLVGTGVLDTYPYTAANGAAAPIPFEENATRLWHPVYFQAEGECVQIELTMNDIQMRDKNIQQCDFTLHAMVIFCTPTSSRLQ